MRNLENLLFGNGNVSKLDVSNLSAKCLEESLKLSERIKDSYRLYSRLIKSENTEDKGGMSLWAIIL